MAVAMEKAFSKILGKVIVPTDVSKDESLRKGLLCIDCNIKITFRMEHERNKQMISAGFIRRKGIEHKSSCRFNTLGQVTIIAQESDAILESINESKFNLRLTLLHKSIPQDINNTSREEKKSVNTTVNQEQKYQSKGKLSSYLATMKKIIELRNSLEDKKELHSIVEISCQNRKVKWESFYYEPERYLEAHKYLKRLNWQERHPICIEGKIHNIRFVEELGKYAIDLKWGKAKVDSKGIKCTPSVSVLLNNKQLLKIGFQKGQCIALCALCTQKVKKRTGLEYLNIYAKIYHKNQIVIL
ncbi:hypothetical protein [Thalassobacillus devorans]|uniref:hypothetical protein n=1 Tax=Thalassobacillus devorans TaxID=279813 RepID=UPI000A1C8C72|nr:hypothetical protein [Thalassobacillus devorans]